MSTENFHITHSVSIEPAEPLWKRAPVSDKYGKPVSDFMMLIPALRSKPSHLVKKTIQDIEIVLHQYKSVVVFADLNMKLNVLWVSVKPVPGICLELPTAIKMRVPDALLVAQQVDQ